MWHQWHQTKMFRQCHPKQRLGPYYGKSTHNTIPAFSHGPPVDPLSLQIKD